MYAEERQQAMAAQVAHSGRLSVAELAEAFRVTTETVRRDLSALERAGLVRRVHGGAVPGNALAVLEMAVGERDREHEPEKDRIARAALALVPADGSVVIDAGTTTARLAHLIPQDSRITAVTHAVPIAARLAGHPALTLRLLPGRVRPTTQAAVGADTVEAIARLRTDVAFVGTNGLSLAHGLSTPDADEAAVKRAVVASARRVVVLADSSKIGLEHLVRFAGLGDVDTLVTDEGVATEDRRALTEAGVEVLVA